MKFDFSTQPTIDTVPEAFRSLYEETDEGFTLAEAHVGVATAVQGFTTSLTKSRAEAKTAKQATVDLSPLSEYGGSAEEILATFTTQMDEYQSQIADSGKAKLNLDKVKDDLNKAHAVSLAASDKRSEALRGQLYNVIVKNEAVTAISAQKGDAKLLMPFVERQIAVKDAEDGQYRAYVVDDAGDQRYSVTTGEALTIQGLVAEMKASADYGKLFTSEAPSGGGGNPSGFKGTRQKAAVMSSTEKISEGLKSRRQ